MSGWLYLVVVVIAAALAYAMQPRMPKQKRPTLADFAIPRANQGDPVPMVFGTVTITGATVAWYGDLLIQTETEDGVRTRKFYMGLHFILCYGPVDALTRIYAGERLAWSGDVTASDTITISQGSLFGGKRLQGGIEGDVDVMMGESTQTANAYLSAVQGTPQPAYRGLLSLVANQIYISANVTQVEPWSFRVKRIASGWYGGTAWYPEAAEVCCESGAVWRVILLAHLDDFTDSGPDARVLNQQGTAGAGPGPTISNAQYKYSANSLYCDGTSGASYGDMLVATPGPENDQGEITGEFCMEGWIYPEDNRLAGLFGHYDRAASTGHALIVQRNASGYAQVELLNHFTSTYNTIITGNTLIPTGAWAHVACTRDSSNVIRLFVNGVLQSTTYTHTGLLVGDYGRLVIGGQRESTTRYNIFYGYIADVRITRDLARYTATFTPPAALLTDDTATGLSNCGMNPAHIIYQVLTDPDWGMGLSTDWIDETSFISAADTFASECLGLCLQWTRQESGLDFIQHICDHAACILRIDPLTGKFNLKAIRDDYDAGALDEYDETTIAELVSWERVGYGELVGEVTITYRDSATNKDGAVTLQNLAVIQAQSGIVSESIELPGLRNESLARRVCMRELKARSVPLARAKVKLTRAAWGIQPGDVFKLSWAKLGLSSVIMRAVSTDGGNLDDGLITVECTEDVYGMPDSTYSSTQATAWTDPVANDETTEIVRILENGTTRRTEINAVRYAE